MSALNAMLEYLRDLNGRKTRSRKRGRDRDSREPVHRSKYVCIPSIECDPSATCTDKPNVQQSYSDKDSSQ